MRHKPFRTLVTWPYPIRKIHGLSLEHAVKLGASGVTDTQAMLELGRTASQRATLAEKTGIPLAVIAALAGVSDLGRLSAMTPAVAHLLVESGITSLRRLMEGDPQTLAEQVAACNCEHFILRATPDAAKLRAYQVEAARLPHILDI
jgi:hypothetical protein